MMLDQKQNKKRYFTIYLQIGFATFRRLFTRRQVEPISQHLEISQSNLRQLAERCLKTGILEISQIPGPEPRILGLNNDF